jgi:hypothetical protein
LSSKLGFPGLRLHDLRGTHETLLLDAGVPVHVVAARCGHDPAVLLRSYAKRTRKADTSAAAVIGTLSRGLLGDKGRAVGRNKMGEQIRLEGRFTVKEGSEDRLFLVYEAGPGPMVTIKLRAGITRPEADEIANTINRGEDGVALDFDYSPAAELGFGPPLIRLRKMQEELHSAMSELIEKKNYFEAERRLLIVDKLMLDLIKDAGGHVV